MMVKALEQNGAKVYVVGLYMDALEKVAKEEAVSLMKKQNQEQGGAAIEVPISTCDGVLILR